MKTSRCVLCTLLLCFAGAQCAGAADWWFAPAAQNNPGDALGYVDKSSMRQTRGTGIVNASVWIFHRREQTSEFGSYRSEKLHMTVNCETREAGPDSGALLSAFGGEVHRFKAVSPTLSRVVPDSAGDVIARFMCSEGKQPPRSLPVYDPSRDVEQRFAQIDRERGAQATPSP